MMHIILIRPPHPKYSEHPGYPPISGWRNPYEPLGLEYLAAYIRSKGHVIKIFDFLLDDKTSLQAVLDYIYKEKVVVIGFTMQVGTIDTTKEIAGNIKEKYNSCYIFCGGPLPTHNPQEVLDKIPSIDGVVVGEGEIAFNKLVEEIESNRSWKNLPGVFSRNTKKFIKNQLIPNLDTLPLPSRDYASKTLGKGQFLQISSSRGCTGNCAFCSIYSFYVKQANTKEELWRPRSPKSIIKEIKFLKKKFNISTFEFIDSNFMGPFPEGLIRLKKFYQLLKKEKLNISFKTTSRIDNCPEDIIKKLKSVGLKMIFLGAESANQNILDSLNKNITLKQSKDTINMLKGLDIDCMIGFIWFTKDVSLFELKENINFVEETGLEYFYPTPNAKLRYDPGSRITEELKNKDKPCKNFKDKAVSEVFEGINQWVTNNMLLYKKMITLRFDYWHKEIEIVNQIKQLYKSFRRLEIELMRKLVKAVEQNEDTKIVFNEFCYTHKELVEDMDIKADKYLRQFIEI